MWRHWRAPLVCIVLVAAIAASASAAIVTSTKGSLPNKTVHDMSTLAARESAVQSELEVFAKLGGKAPVNSWETKFKAAESAQSIAMNIVNGDFVTQSKPKSSGSNSGSSIAFQDTSGNAYRVVAEQLIDPAQGADSFTTPNAGFRFVAAVFKITDAGHNQISDDANSNASVVGSNDQSYSADFDSVAGCTNFNSGEYQLAAGQSVTGCVVFQVPTGVKVIRVEWSPAGGFGGNFGQWKVP